ncbi:hypothetical protein ASPZODRAFT_155160 [Penicilliopsis zonata CBS 506.65]|uniref:Efficient mitochondria targeting-associated protein 19 n=1 Tax=Penicilliopsis zonata CBS 506.65 TaxID=1073090 RepID=A0A1L9S6A3_9EURO|nr:hypothetical protein ASPZODRAFT_155160 [Penicilliopsis zonata CBS 506.65]OJJ42696.1 hypothetical protein ASPZODRAFT_155160 [Penicilliopsis zonata CBS 506.65]
MAPLWSRKRDMLYLFFFATHLPIIFMVDTVPILPAALQTDLMHRVRDFYVNTYHDKFFEAPQPVWFTAFIWMELLYHAPLSLWAVGALIRDDPMVPVHLLVFGMQSFVTTVACLAEVWSWTDRSLVEKQNITMLYGPYIAFGGLVALDMFTRLRRQLCLKPKQE